MLITNFKFVFIIFIFIQLLNKLKRIQCFSEVRASCRTVPNLTKEQMELCYQASDVTLAAIEGLELAARECQYQFKWNRWNCSSLASKRQSPYSSNIFKRGYRESAFGHAIVAAGVVQSVARACSQGRLISCGCDPNSQRQALKKSLRESPESEKNNTFGDFFNNPLILEKKTKRTHGINTYEVMSKRKMKQMMANRWKWAGCSHNIRYGIEFSELFLDSREKAGDIQSQINLHNNKVGRLAIVRNLVSRCKCHGLSGSCQLKTCWKSSPDFRMVGKILKQQFRRAILVDQSNFGQGVSIVYQNGGRKRNAKSADRRPSITRSDLKNNAWPLQKKKKNRLENSLFFFQKSPNFCEKDLSSDIQGTQGRRCNRTSIGSDSCQSLCCGRGYSLIKEVSHFRCNCKFFWCCHVECKICEQIEWISICN